MSSPLSDVLVIGARSKIGSAVVRALAGGPAPVRVLTRSVEAADELSAAGVQPLVGDLADPEGLAAALDGVGSVFLLSSPAPEAVAWQTGAIDAARRAGVAHLVRVSVFGADSASPARMARQHGEIDAHLLSSGVPFTVLRPNYFAQNVLESVLPAIDATGSFYGSLGDARLSMVDTEDVGQSAAAVLTDPTRHLGRTYDLTGPQALSYADVAAVLTGHLGREVRYVDVPPEAVRAALTGYGLPAWTVDALDELFDGYRQAGPRGWASVVSPDLAGLLGRPGRPLTAVLDRAASSGSPA